jgi:hypothetical protein
MNALLKRARQARYVRRMRAQRKAEGRCVMCRSLAQPGRTLCRYHLDYKRGRRQPVPKITFEMYVHDVQCVAIRLNIRRVSSKLYEQEGSFSMKPLRRLKRRWADVCAAAGLLPTEKGYGYVDLGTCARCPRSIWIPRTRNRHYCKECRCTVKRRKGEVLGTC